MIFKYPNFFLIIVFLAFSTISNGQSIKRQTIGCYGHNEVSGNLVVSQTVGQPFATSSFSDNKIGLFPGYQQPMSYTKPIKDNKFEFKALEIYPNPTSEGFYINNSIISESVDLKVTDISGRVIYRNLVSVNENNYIESNEWDSGLYVIQLTDNNTKEIYSTKLVITK